MKETAFKIFWVLTVCLAMVSFSACGKTSGDDDISVDEAESMMIAYLENKGFGGEDFLSESDIMVIEDEKVYVFSWRTKSGENADRLLGMYAVSFDGKIFYEYQSGRNEWIADMSAE
ncbi:MAG: hypothetical protein OSJ54_08545 [Oscillospiraceae bacterium]|nr:hypothetical protein [Oscillospiraceae bacterium]